MFWSLLFFKKHNTHSHSFQKRKQQGQAQAGPSAPQAPVVKVAPPLRWTKRELRQLEHLLCALGPGRYALMYFLMVRDSPIDKRFEHSVDEVAALSKTLVRLYAAAYEIVSNPAAAPTEAHDGAAAVSAAASAGATAALREGRGGVSDDGGEGGGEEARGTSSPAVSEDALGQQAKLTLQAKRHGPYVMQDPLVELLRPYLQVRTDQALC